MSARRQNVIPWPTTRARLAKLYGPSPAEALAACLPDAAEALAAVLVDLARNPTPEGCDKASSYMGDIEDILVHLRWNLTKDMTP